MLKVFAKKKFWIPSIITLGIIAFIVISKITADNDPFVEVEKIERVISTNC